MVLDMIPIKAWYLEKYAIILLKHVYPVGIRFHRSTKFVSIAFGVIRDLNNWKLPFLTRDDLGMLGCEVTSYVTGKPIRTNASIPSLGSWQMRRLPWPSKGDLISYRRLIVTLFSNFKIWSKYDLNCPAFEYDGTFVVCIDLLVEGPAVRFLPVL